MKNRIIVHATNKDGDGYVQEIGRFQDIKDIELRVGMFVDDVVISFAEETEEERKFLISVNNL